MAIDAGTKFTPGWYLMQLENRLVARRDGRGWGRLKWDRKGRPPLKLLDAHLRGDPPLPMISNKWQDGMREFLRTSRMNVAEMCVDAKAHKMVPLGFRTAADSDRNGDQKASRIFKHNQMDLGCADVFRDMLGLADGYMIVGPPIDPDAADPIPLITSESPFEVITVNDARTRKPVAALKLFTDEWGEEEFAYLYLPGVLFVATRKIGSRGASNWNWDEVRSITYPSYLSDVVPVRAFTNRGGVGEFEPHIDVLDRINDTIFERVVIAKYQAFRQRAIKGLEFTDEDGNDIDYSKVFTSDPGSLWTVDEGVEFWESQPIDLTPVRMALQDDLKGFAAATSTPLHLITPDAAQGSAEGASLQRESGTWAVEDRRRRANHPLSEIMALGFRFVGDDSRTDASQFSTIWAPAERFSLAARYDAFQKGVASGLPQPYLVQDVLQGSPDDQQWIDSLRAEDLLFAAPSPAESAAALAVAGQGPKAVTATAQDGATAAPTDAAAK